MFTIHATLFKPSLKTLEEAVNGLIENFPEERTVLWLTPHLTDTVPTLDIVLDRELSPIQETYLNEHSIIARYTVHKAGTLLPALLTENQVKVVTHLLKSSVPLLIHDNDQIENSSYLLDSRTNGTSLIANFAHWTEQHLVQTIDTENGMQVQHLHLHDYVALDRLCAAWIEFRCKYLLPKEPGQTAENDLGDLDEKPF